MKYIYIIILSLVFHIGLSQTYVLPDANLRDKLKTSYPQVMQGDLLDITKAGQLIGTLDLRWSNIIDASGVEYFTSINTLDLSFNNLTNIPNISTITGLTNFYASNNKLTSLPDLSSLNLVDFQVVNNNLTEFPNLSGSTNLLYIFCSNNNITQLPTLSQFPLLKKLVVGQNPYISKSIDVSSCIHLTELHVHRSGLDTIIGLHKLTELTTLYAWTNNIKSFKGLDLNTKLNLCMIFDNPITELPLLSNKPSLNILNIRSCLLTFEDIQPLLLNPPTTFSYTPQRMMSYTDITARANNNYNIAYSDNNPLSTNTYVWIKNGVVIDSSNKSTYSFNPIQYSDSGTYQLKVYNSYIPNLILESNKFKMSVLPCIEIMIPSLKIVSQDCSKGYTVDFSQNVISGGTPPFSYVLVTNTTQKNITYPLVENIEAGSYYLKIIDSKFCSASDDFNLSRIDNCDPILTPNGDGIMDTYYLEKKGKVCVYDVQRNLVSTFQAPYVWDGSDKNGVALDAGLYILIIEGENPIYLTIVR